MGSRLVSHPVRALDTVRVPGPVQSTPLQFSSVQSCPLGKATQGKADTVAVALAVGVAVGVGHGL